MQFRVRARSFVGEGEVSDVVEAITTPGAPVAGLVDMAQQVEVEGVSPESLNVSWSVPQVYGLRHTEMCTMVII